MLDAASKSPITGATFTKQLAQITSGKWKPSPGSTYYLLNELSSHGLLTRLEAQTTGQPAYIITARGSEELANARSTGKESLVEQMMISAMLAGVLQMEALAELFTRLMKSYSSAEPTVSFDDEIRQMTLRLGEKLKPAGKA